MPVRSQQCVRLQVVRVSRSLRVAKAMHAGLKREVQIFQDAWPYTIQEFYQQVYTACAAVGAAALRPVRGLRYSAVHNGTQVRGGARAGGSNAGREGGSQGRREGARNREGQSERASGSYACCDAARSADARQKGGVAVR